MHTIIRNHACNRSDFVFHSDRLIRLVVEHALGHLPFKNEVVRTPNGDAYNGVSFSKKICGVSIIRSGEAMENAARVLQGHQDRQGAHRAPRCDSHPRALGDPPPASAGP